MNRKELIALFKTQSIPKSAYCIEGFDSLSGSDIYVLKAEQHYWCVEYWERGQVRQIFKSESESEACAELYSNVMRNFA